MLSTLQVPVIQISITYIPHLIPTVRNTVDTPISLYQYSTVQVIVSDSNNGINCINKLQERRHNKKNFQYYLCYRYRSKWSESYLCYRQGTAVSGPSFRTVQTCVKLGVLSDPRHRLNHQPTNSDTVTGHNTTYLPTVLEQYPYSFSQEKQCKDTVKWDFL